MSPRSKVTREQWVAAGRRALGLGRVPADMPLSELIQLMGVSVGSFYSHFPDGVEQYYLALIEDWSEDSRAEMPGGGVQAVRDPRDRLRLIWARWVATAGPGGAMRRWAERAGLPQRSGAAAEAAAAAAAAVAAVDHAVIGHVRRALEELGLTGAEPTVVAEVVVRAWVGTYHVSGPAVAGADAEKNFDVLLDFIAAAAAARRRGGEVAMAAGGAPAEVLLYMIARGLSPEDQRELLAQAQQLVYGLVFTILAIFQFTLALLLAVRPGPAVYRLGIWGSGLIVLVYIVTRLIPLPGASVPEEVDALGG